MTPIPIQIYIAATLKAGLKLYAKTGIQPSKTWTPTAMLRRATRITGKTYKRGKYLDAANDLQAKIDEWLDNGRRPE